MDPIQALQEILNQIVELGGAGLDLIQQAAGGGGQAPAEAAPPAPAQ
jgi:hypothetical protein